MRRFGKKSNEASGVWDVEKSKHKIVASSFFARDPQIVAQDLLGKVIYTKHNNIWLSAQIIETEAYYLDDKASHAFLGYTEKRKALFMPPGTIYMYYSRGGDSLNISCLGSGNAVLIKSGYPYSINNSSSVLDAMQKLNPTRKGEARKVERLCAGQVLLCKSLGLSVKEWDAHSLDPKRFYIADVNYKPEIIIQTQRLGITKGRDEHLFYRFLDKAFSSYSTNNPLTKKKFQLNRDYFVWPGSPILLRDTNKS